MDGNRLRLGAGRVGSPAKTSRGLGGRPLGTSSWWLGLDCRPLAVKNNLIDNRQPGAGARPQAIQLGGRTRHHRRFAVRRRQTAGA